MLFKEDTVARADAMAIRKGVGFYRWTHDLVEITGADAKTALVGEEEQKQADSENVAQLAERGEQE